MSSIRKFKITIGAIEDAVEGNVRKRKGKKTVDRNRYRKLLSPGLIDDMEIDEEILFSLEEDNPGALLETVTLFSDDEETERTLEEQEAFIEGFLKRAQASERATYQDYLPYRIQTAWRILRFQALVKGIIGQEDLLADIDTTHSNPWNDGFTNVVHTDEGANLNQKRLGEVLKYVARTSHSLLPPEAVNIGKGYKPKEDQALVDWIFAYKSCADYLHVASGSFNQPRSGEYGIEGLYNPQLTRFLFPSQFQIIMFEEMLIDETINKLIRTETLDTRAYLIKSYGLSGQEAENLVAIARQHIAHKYSSDAANDKPLMLLRFENFLGRAKKAANLPLELKCLKEMATVMGLGKVQTNDYFSDVIDTVASVAKSQDEDQPKQITND